MEEEEVVEINGVELHEGDTLWRYAALRTWGINGITLTQQDPDDVLRETAEALVDNYPDAVNVDEMREQDDPYEVVHANLRANPGIYNDTELMRYHAMEVKKVDTSYGVTEITIIDWKEEQRFAFNSERDEADPGDYIILEPLATLEKHLGVTILPVSDDD